MGTLAPSTDLPQLLEGHSVALYIDISRYTGMRFTQWFQEVHTR